MYYSSRQTVRKEYTSAFLIDPPKLSRIINVLEDKFNTLQLKFKLTYTLTLSRGDVLHLNTIEQISKHDNTIQNQIKSLKIEVDGIEQNKFNNLECSIHIESGFTKNVSLSVSSCNYRITQELFGLLEEQIQRLFINDWVYRLPRNEFMDEGFFSLIFILLLTPTLLFAYNLNQWRSEKKILIELLEDANTAKTNEEKITFLFETTKYRIEQQIASNSSFNLSNFLNVDNLVIAFPILIVFCCGFYAVKYCYPTGVFLWGDYEAHYQKLVDTRKTLWGVVILGLAIGIIGSLFVTVLAGRINLG